MFNAIALREKQAQIAALKQNFRKNPAAWRNLRNEFRRIRDELTVLFFSAPTIEAGAPFELEKRYLLSFAREATDIIRQTTGETLPPSDLFRTR